MQNVLLDGRFRAEKAERESCRQQTDVKGIFHQQIKVL